MPEHDEFERVDALLRGMAPHDEPPEELRRRTLAALAGADAPEQHATTAKRGRWRLRGPRAPRLALAFAAVALGAAVLTVALATRDDGPPLEMQADLTAPSDRAVRAHADVFLTGIGRVVEFDSDDLPILPKGEFYELWFVGPGDRPGEPNRISAGTFHPDEDGDSHVTFAAAVDPARYPVLAVTAEPGDGDPSPAARDVLRSGGG